MDFSTLLKRDAIEVLRSQLRMEYCFIEGKIMSIGTPITKEDYIKHGITPVEFDETRAFQESDGDLMTDEERREYAPNKHIPASIARTIGIDQGPVPEGARHTDFTEVESYNHAAEISRLAAKLHPTVAPTVTEEDMPAFMPNDTRRHMLTTMRGFGVDMSRASLKALEIEATPSHHYWDRAWTECLPVLQEGHRKIKSSPYGRDGSNRESQIEDAAAMLKERLHDPSKPLGTTQAISALAGALFTPEAEWTKSQSTVLISHLVAHSRLGNRAARQFAKAAESLPAEANDVADHVLFKGKEPEVMLEVKRMASMSKNEFLEASKCTQEAAVHALKLTAERVPDGPDARLSRVRASAIAKKSFEIARLPDSEPGIFEHHAGLNRELFASRIGHEEISTTLLASEMARKQVSEREKSMSELFKPQDQSTR